MSTSVVILDGDVELTERMVDELESFDHNVVATSSPEDAVHLVGSDRVDLLLAELELGTSKEFNVLRTIRPRSPRTRVALMTDQVSAEHYRRAIEAGAVEILTKPVALETLLRTVRTAAEVEGGLRGNLCDIALMEVLQMMHFSRRTVSLLIGSGAAIHMRDGEVVHAQVGQESGKLALAALLTVDSGSFVTTSIQTRVRTIVTPFSRLILDVLGRIGERSHDSGDGAAEAEAELFGTSTGTRWVTRTPRPVEPVPALGEYAPPAPSPDAYIIEPEAKGTSAESPASGSHPARPGPGAEAAPPPDVKSAEEETLLPGGAAAQADRSDAAAVQPALPGVDAGPSVTEPSVTEPSVEDGAAKTIELDAVRGTDFAVDDASSGAVQEDVAGSVSPEPGESPTEQGSVSAMAGVRVEAEDVPLAREAYVSSDTSREVEFSATEDSASDASSARPAEASPTDAVIVPVAANLSDTQEIGDSPWFASSVPDVPETFEGISREEGDLRAAADALRPAGSFGENNALPAAPDRTERESSDEGSVPDSGGLKLFHMDFGASTTVDPVPMMAFVEDLRTSDPEPNDGESDEVPQGDSGLEGRAGVAVPQSMPSVPELPGFPASDSGVKGLGAEGEAAPNAPPQGAPGWPSGDEAIRNADAPEFGAGPWVEADPVAQSSQTARVDSVADAPAARAWIEEEPAPRRRNDTVISVPAWTWGRRLGVAGLMGMVAAVWLLAGLVILADPGSPGWELAFRISQWGRGVSEVSAGEVIEVPSPETGRAVAAQPPSTDDVEVAESSAAEETATEVGDRRKPERAAPSAPARDPAPASTSAGVTKATGWKPGSSRRNPGPAVVAGRKSTATVPEKAVNGVDAIQLNARAVKRDAPKAAATKIEWPDDVPAAAPGIPPARDTADGLAANPNAAEPELPTSEASSAPEAEGVPGEFDFELVDEFSDG